MFNPNHNWLFIAGYFSILLLEISKLTNGLKRNCDLSNVFLVQIDSQIFIQLDLLDKLVDRGNERY